MPGPFDDFEKLLQMVADGESVDWDTLEKAASDEETRALLRQLRLVSEVAEVHRSQVDEVEVAPPDVAITGQVTWQVGGGWPPPRLPHVGGSGQPDEGRPWGHLVLVRKIGEGTYGEVFQAHDTWLDHPVALKLLKPEAESRVQPADLLHEARKLARVRHTNVVTVHGADRHDGRVGFWMDFIDGETLASRVSRGRMSPGEAISVGQEVCRALAAVHRSAIIHRDVKAQNVMRAHDGGRIILMDFGAGQFIDDPSFGQRAQGTPLYLAPELLRGDVATIRSDIYAAGVLLYFLVTGTFPVQAASTQALIEAHARGHRRRLRDERPDLPDSFITAVERAIDPDPAARYGSAGEMESGLNGGVSTRPIVVPAPAPVPPGPSLGDYIKRLVGIAAALIALMGVLGFIAARTFEVALRIDPDFSMGLAGVFTVGAQGLLPFVIYWIGLGAIAAILFGLRLLLPGAVVARVKRLFSPLTSVNPAGVAAAIFIAAAVLAALLTWRYVDVFTALIALWRDPRLPVSALTILDPASRHILEDHGVYSAILSFLLGVAVWRWFPRLERRADDVSLLRPLRWGTLAVAFLVIALAVAPRRAAWERFPIAAFDRRQALVIGTTRDEFLLYAPDEAGRPRFRVQRDAPALSLTGEARPLFVLTR